MHRAASLALAVAAALLAPGPARAQDDDAHGRDFPKTLTLDEPGIDDEASLPTLAAIPTPGGFTLDASVEIDKRLTDRLDIQLNDGQRSRVLAGSAARTGWDNLALTSKFVAYDAPASETLLTLGLTREFGRTGTAGLGAAPAGSTLGTVYFGQGLGTAPVPAWLRPVALTGTLAYALPDRTHDDGARLPQTLQLGASLQYSLRYLDPARLGSAATGLPAWTGRLIAITELTYAQPLSASDGSDARQGFLAPGLIYAGDGYQLAAEALIPLTAASGHGLGAVAQLNLSFRALGLEALARPLF